MRSATTHLMHRRLTSSKLDIILLTLGLRFRLRGDLLEMLNLGPEQIHSLPPLVSTYTRYRKPGSAYLRVHDGKILLHGDRSLCPGLRRVRCSELGLDRLLVVLGRLQLGLLLCDDRVLLLGVLTRDLEQALEFTDGREARSGNLTGSDDVSLECGNPCLEGLKNDLRRV